MSVGIKGRLSTWQCTLTSYVCAMDIDREVMEEGREAQWLFSKAKLDQFQYLCQLGSRKIDVDCDTSRENVSRKAVPWWTEECSEPVKERNAA